MKPKNNRIYIPPITSGEYCTRTELSDGRVEDISRTTDLEEAVGTAWSYHAATGQKTWVFNLKTGRTIQRVERGERGRAAGGGR